MITMDEELIQAYKETHYTVQDVEPFVLRIGEVSEDLMACHKRHRVDCSAFITAWNPFSQQLTAQENEERHQALIAEIRGRSLSFLSGEPFVSRGGLPGACGSIGYQCLVSAIKA